MSEQRVYPPGALIWVPDPEIVWRKAEVIRSSETELVIKYDENGPGEVILDPSLVPTYMGNVEIFSSEGLMGLDDLTQLTHLHEPALLNSLNLRFDVDQIYTFTGPILLAVNPFKTIPNMYSLETIKRFLSDAENEAQALSRRRPHVFWTGATAFRGLCRLKSSQTILISGESGAGKTESTKFVMKLLALAGSEDWDNRSPIENQVLQSNPLLEALGNAKTLRNDNSSRFGKFIEMQFSLVPKPGVDGLIGRLAGARIHTYLLETVRVCHQSEGERNYHSFYQLCAAAATTGDDGKYVFPSKITAPGAKKCTFDLSLVASYDNYTYLTQSSCAMLSRMDDVEEFENTVLAMQTIGVPLEEQVAIFDVMAAVLYLGNLQFETASGSSEGVVLKQDTSPSFRLAAKLLGIKEEDLMAALTVRTLVARGETYKISLKLREAEDARDALARALYGTMFLKVVQQTNESIGYRDDVKLFCGVLDIFGFECFDLNSFEQLCINFTNERLQQFFNNYIFRCEEQLYREENIPWSALDFPDNQDCVSMINHRTTGIFAMIDEECMVPGGSDRGFCNKMKEKFKGNCRFGIIKTKPEWFVVHHFAGPVGYSSEGFLDKNRDQLSQDIQSCVKSSGRDFVRSLFRDFLVRGQQSEEAPKTNARKKIVTVSSEFRNQLAYLMDTIAITDPHFIRCLKPNPKNAPDEFERKSVTEQLRYAGVLQAVQVSRAGYPVRLPHQEAFLDYRALCDRSIRKQFDDIAAAKDRVLLMMKHLDAKFHFPLPAHSPNSWAVGNTLVFFKHESYAVLSTERADLRQRSATKLQAVWKGTQQCKAYSEMRNRTIVIQTHIRSYLARKRVQRLREDRAVRRLQRAIRGFLVRLGYLRVLADVVCIQAAWKGYKARLACGELRRYRAACRIQAHWRGYQAQRYYTRLRRATQMAQLKWRSIQAKRQLRRLRQGQREATALLAQIHKLNDANKALKAKAEEAEARVLSLTARETSLAAERDTLLERVAKMNEELMVLNRKFHDQESFFKERIATLLSEANAKQLAVHTADDNSPALAPPESPGRAPLFTTPLAPIDKLIETTPEKNEEKESHAQSISSLPTGFGTERPKGFLETQEMLRPTTGHPSKVGHGSRLHKTDGQNAAAVKHTGGGVDERPGKKTRPAEWEEATGHSKVLHSSATMGPGTSDKSPPSRLDGLLNRGFSMNTVKSRGSVSTGGGPSLASFMSKIHSYFTPTDKNRPVQDHQGGGQHYILRPSDTAPERDNRNSGSIENPLSPVYEFADRPSAITCLVFGQEKLHETYYLMAASCKDGSITVYKIMRTPQEIVIWRSEKNQRSTAMAVSGSPFQKDGSPASNSRIGKGYQQVPAVEHLRLFGHTRAVTHMLFSHKEDQLITTSIDKSVRFWSLETGDMLRVFADSTPCLVTAYLPFDPAIFIVGNSNSILRVVDSRNGVVLQKLRAESEMRALKFDTSGLYCYGGTRSGVLHVMESADLGTIKFRFKVQLNRASITCITFVPSTAADKPPQLFVNSCDSTVTIVDCIYKRPTATLSTLTVRQRLRIAQSLLPLRCCYSGVDRGWLISASEDRNIYIYSVGDGTYKQLLLRKHDVPVVTVAVNAMESVLVSGDSVGRVVLWRQLLPSYARLTSSNLETVM